MYIIVQTAKPSSVDTRQSGVPQGTIPDPFKFCKLINDLPLHIQDNIENLCLTEVSALMQVRKR